MNTPLSIDHNQHIARAAKASLAPLGCKQKGRSRLWYADQGWWVAIVEFQPGSWNKGSYLNAAAMWLWNAKSHWSFDEGDRGEGFHSFQSEAQFSSAADRLAASAASHVVALRERFSSIGAVAAYMEGKRKKGIWDHYHAAISAAMVGRAEYALSQFEKVADATAHAPWVAELQAKAANFAEVASSIELLRLSVAKEVQVARALLKLPPGNGGIFGPSAYRRALIPPMSGQLSASRQLPLMLTGRVERRR